MHTATTTSPTGAPTCADTEYPDDLDEAAAPEEAEAQARRHWLATAAWPEVAFASA